MALDLTFLEKALTGNTVPRPRGALAGHAVGELFDKEVETMVAAKFPGRTFRSAALLNQLFTDHPGARTGQSRLALLGPPALRELLKRGVAVLEKWTPDAPLVEKQDDTADVVVLPTTAVDLNIPTVHLIDVKSSQVSKIAQPPNIISARKVAAMAKTMLETGNFDSHDVTYVGVYWHEESDLLKVDLVATCELFKIPPPMLYINWSAALQIQFKVSAVPQSYGGSVRDWCGEFLEHFLKSAKARELHFRSEFVLPYETFLKSVEE